MMEGLASFSSHLVWLWLTVFIILLVIELLTVGLFTIWFAGGALVALACAAAHVILPIQIVVFFAVSGVLLVLFRPMVQEKFNTKRTPTNADRLIGQKAVVKQQIDNLKSEGRVEVRGQDWAAYAADEDQIIPEGTEVVITEVTGVRLKVRMIESQETDTGTSSRPEAPENS